MQELYPIKFDILPQPDETTCGPTCLHSLYRFYDDHLELKKVIKEVHAFEGGGTLGVWLACHALKRGYEATIYSYNLQIFDPTWFKKGSNEIKKKLSKQLAQKNDIKVILETRAYLEFLSLGGVVKLEDLSRELLRKYLTEGVPILAGLSATYLYRCSREMTATGRHDDIRGDPSGHFVVLCGYEKKSLNVMIADPYLSNPYSPTQKYEIFIDRVICAILLGILTYDANILILKPKKNLR